MAQNGPKLPKNDQKWSSMAKNGHKWPKNGPKSPENGQK